MRKSHKLHIWISEPWQGLYSFVQIHFAWWPTIAGQRHFIRPLVKQYICLTTRSYLLLQERIGWLIWSVYILGILVHINTVCIEQIVSQEKRRMLPCKCLGLYQKHKYVWQAVPIMLCNFSGASVFCWWPDPSFPCLPSPQVYISPFLGNSAAWPRPTATCYKMSHYIHAIDKHDIFSHAHLQVGICIMTIDHVHGLFLYTRIKYSPCICRLIYCMGISHFCCNLYVMQYDDLTAIYWHIFLPSDLIFSELNNSDQLKYSKAWSLSYKSHLFWQSYNHI